MPSEGGNGGFCQSSDIYLSQTLFSSLRPSRRIYLVLVVKEGNLGVAPGVKGTRVTW